MEQQPAQNLEQLKALVVAISQGESSVSLGRKAYETLARLIEQPEQVALSNITSLAAYCEVNASTLTRLAKSLGYKGFNEFQEVFRASLTAETPQYFYSQQADRLADQGALFNFQQIMQESMQNLQQLERQLDADEVAAIAALLAEAEHVRLYAERQFYSLTNFLSYGLSLIRPQVQHLDAKSGLVESLVGLGEDDVLIVASCKPYTRHVVEVAQAVRALGVKVVAITDFRSSPLASCADYAVFIPDNSSFIVNSMAAHVVFAEGLINTVAKRLGGKARESLQANETLFQQLKVNM